MKSMRNKKFERTLKTNYKYSCLATLCMTICKEKGLYNLSRKIAKFASIGLQKNYSIILLRLCLILR